MIYFIIFILFLSIYEISYIMKNVTESRNILIVIYIIMAIIVALLGMYYSLNRYGNSISYYMFKVINIYY
ncbi:MAG: hypothetical protein PHF21_05300 [Bacilli bacterium]|nr:hypothetical protein [Bacilli bacterium]